jgi:selenide,water dikinase
LDRVLKKLEFPHNQKVIVDSSRADDAGVYLLDNNRALVQTTDFFTPIVDDPYLFGQIAAANAVSDIYAMGAQPLTALNILCFPDTKLDAQALELILKGGIDKMTEAGVAITGGHSVSDNELKYGLAVTGVIDPKDLKLNHTVEAGDQLVLTKPLGTGLLTTALKNGVLSEGDISDAISNMLLLNREASVKMYSVKVNATTDITGYGLLGHLWEMISGSGLSAQISVSSIPFYEKSLEYAQKGLYVPGGTISNTQFVGNHVEFEQVAEWYKNVLFDPQTSGGLLLSIPKKDVSTYIELISENYPLEIKVVGELVEGQNKIRVRP